MADRAGAGGLQSRSAFPIPRGAGSTTPSAFPGCSASSPRARSTEPIPGINELVARNAKRIRSGLVAYGALEALQTNRERRQTRAAQLREHAADLGYALLLKRYVDDPRTADDADHRQGRRQHGSQTSVRCSGASASWWGSASTSSPSSRCCSGTPSHRNFSRRWLLRLAIWSLPLPWIAAELGWVVAEYGRQPWAIDGVLPTFLAASSVSAAQVSSPCAALSCFIRRCSSSTSC